MTVTGIQATPTHRGDTSRGFLSYATDRQGQSWQVALISIALYVPLSIVVLPSLGSPEASVPVALGAVLAYLVQWILMWPARWAIVDRPWSSRHPIVGTAVIFVVVLVAGLLEMTIASASTMPFLESIDDAAGPVVWLGRSIIFLVVASIWSAFHEYRVGLAATRALRSSLERERWAGIARVTEQRADVVNRIAEVLTETIDGHDPDSTPDLTAVARGEVRNISHELDLAVPEYRDVRPATGSVAPWKLVVDEVTRRPIIRPVLMAVVVTFFFALSTVTPATTPPEGASEVSVTTGQTAVSVSVDVTSFLWSLGFIVAIFFVTLVTGIIARRFTQQRLAKLSLGRRIVALAIMLLVMAAVVQIVIQASYVTPGFAASEDAGSLPNLLVTTSIFFIAILILSVRVVAELFAGVARSEQDLNDQLSWEIARANETLAQERRHLATAVHGPVQSAVIAAGMNLQRDLDEGTPRVVALGRAQERLDEIIRSLQDGPRQDRSLQTGLEELQATWEGLCTINVEIAAPILRSVEEDWITAATLCDLMVEAVGNAAMHGRARSIGISLEPDEGALLHLHVRDDGQSTDQGSDPGLGSQTLDEVSVRWERSITSAGTSLDVWLPGLALGDEPRQAISV